MILNFSIYIRLKVASVFGKVKINPRYKHLEYMLENKYISQVQNGWSEVGGFPVPEYGNYYTITSEGKDAMWGKAELIRTKRISWIAIIISLSSLAFSIYQHFEK